METETETEGKGPWARAQRKPNLFLNPFYFMKPVIHITMSFMVYLYSLYCFFPKEVEILCVFGFNSPLILLKAQQVQTKHVKTDRKSSYLLATEKMAVVSLFPMSTASSSEKRRPRRRRRICFCSRRCRESDLGKLGLIWDQL